MKALKTTSIILGGIVAGSIGTTAVSTSDLETARNEVVVSEAALVRIKSNKNKNVKELVWLKERLGEGGDYDLSAATSLEWDEAGLEKARELGISDREILQAGGIGKALYAKALATSQVCGI